MKKFWEKHSLGKMLAIFIGLAIILSWIIPVGTFSGTELATQGTVSIGIADVGNMLYYVIAMAVDKIIFLLVLGAFYGILTKVPAYQKLINSIAKKIEGTEIIWGVIFSLLLTVFTSFASISYASLIFVPFFINILAKTKLDKISVFACTFGSVLLGILGCTFGSEGLFWLDSYMANYSSFDVVKSGMLCRVIILVVAFALYTVLNILHMKKALNNKNEVKAIDCFEIDDAKENVNSWPIIVLLVILSLLVVIGFINWNGYFEVTIFDKFHEWLIGLTIKDTAVFSKILGSSAAALGSADFTLFTISAVLMVFGIIFAIMGRFDFGKLVESILNGLKKIAKPALLLAVVYLVFTIFYLSPMMNTITSKLMKVDGKPNINIDYNGSGIAYFNIDTNDDGKPDKNLVNTGKKCKLNCDTNNDGYPDKNLDFDGNKKIDENDAEILKTFDSVSTLNIDTDGDGTPDVNVDTDKSFFGTILSAFVTNIFHVDFNYTAYAFSGYFATGFAYSLNFVLIVFLTMFGLVAFIAPTSAILVIGLTYTDIEYKDYIKYIWKFIAGITFGLLIMYLVLFLI